MSKNQDQNNPPTPHEGSTWREERGQPEPKAIEGQHAGRRVPEEDQRETMDDSGAGRESRIAGDDAGGGRGYEGGLSVGGNFGASGNSSHQGSSATPGGRTGTTHARGAGRDTEGAFGEERGASNASGLNDYRDAAISKQQTGPDPDDTRTQGGDQ